MCNLYTVRKSAAEVAAHFGVANPVQSNAGDEVYPGTPGVVVRETDGARIAQSMTWGFPLRLKTMSPTARPKPVNNIADLRKGMWIGLARKPEWRCLIPVTAFAEAEAEKGSKTRTWFSVRGEPIFAWAGLWRDSAEWGPVYSGGHDRLQRGDPADPRPHAGPAPPRRIRPMAARLVRRCPGVPGTLLSRRADRHGPHVGSLDEEEDDGSDPEGVKPAVPDSARRHRAGGVTQGH